MPERGDQLLHSRRQKLAHLRQLGINPFPAHFQRTCTVQDAVSIYQAEEKLKGEGARSQSVSVAGRIMSIRGMGKATFLDLRDGTGRIQAHLRRDTLGDGYQLAKELDIGDHLGVSGPLFRTRRGEVTVEASALTVLAKSLKPLPEKWHGLRDVEQRYRQRHLDLISNPEVGAIFIQRSKIIEAIRSFLNRRGFIEVDTPVLVPVAAGAMARPFATHHNTLDQQLYLRIATELYLKRLIVGGFDKVYELGRVFRNEGIDQDHNPEFTMLESYEAYADYGDVMKMVEEMVSAVAQEVLGTTKVEYRDHSLDFAPPWHKVTFLDAVYKHSGIQLAPFIHKQESLEALIAEARGRGLDIGAPGPKTFDKLFNLTVEPNLIEPTFVLDYPKDISPLAKEKEDDGALVERFEGFAGGMEIANAYTELNDPEEQKERFLSQEQLRVESGDEETERADRDFLDTLEYGMPPTGGLGIGIDRLVMLLTGQPSIRDAVLFPQLRSVD